MKSIMPNYEDGIVNVSNSILKYFDVETNHNSLKKLDDILNENKNTNVVLVLFDGLGYNILKKNSKHCPFINKHLLCSLSSVFPTTTMAARTSIESGLNPVEHGLLGWDMYFKKYDNVITLSRNYVKGTKEKITDYHIAKTLLKYDSIVSKIDKKEECYSQKISVYSVHKNESLKKARKKIKEITKNNLKNYIYLYCDEPDHTFHKQGTNSKRSLRVLRKLDKEFKKLCRGLKNTTILLIADHGHLNVEYITLLEHSEIMKMLDGNVSIDSRACSFRVKKEYKKEFPIALKKILKDDFIILSSKEVHDKRLYGTGKENEYYFDALGDYFAIGITNKAIRIDDKVKMHKSTHSGITEDEMLVPLVVFNDKKRG